MQVIDLMTLYILTISMRLGKNALYFAYGHAVERT